ncbi:DUF6307 family protein [Amycolatopsis sp. NBC_01488]|uniref:DUF6307 family protein n=1 Tax=Amycolatopsis sp. NBC_01488 TaxID=2903563 RepID=UPI002E2AEF33|nr:DUF6307 family protein [Amycolatopsis sp. NBC_01488]
MTTDATFVSRYDLRVKLVQDVLKENTKLSATACQALAVQLLHTMDTVPERTR